MFAHVNTKPRSYDDVLNAYHNYTVKWMDFVTRCPELLDRSWFYEGNGISDTMAVEMRRLVSVWVMLYGTDVVKEIIPFINYEVARKCRQGLFIEETETPAVRSQELVSDMAITCMMHLLTHVSMDDLANARDLVQTLKKFNLPCFTDAMARVGATLLHLQQLEKDA